MEYLMTYGWAILIIAVVLAALFQLGVFSGATSPRAQPDTCRVIRPMGVGTSSGASLQGVCTGLLPEYVAQFNGQSSVISVSYPNNLDFGSPLTVSLWMDPYISANNGFLCKGNGFGGTSFSGSYCLGYSGTSFRVGWVNTTNQHSLLVTPLTGWQQLSFVIYANNTAIVYLNGRNKASAANAPLNGATGELIIGRTYFGNNYFNGAISNIQIYNTSLSANEISVMYREGIGGAPIRVDTLVGWWPLNGNTNDTSGNLNKGIPTNVMYISSWTQGYSLH